ncbi:MAG: hypothetical protein JKY54_09960, partial [Flavobacteriales bacterium]|nr:hypothetical protein [Flavobacteriales bacterium]
MKHLTRTGSNPYTENLQAYYQFNLANSTSIMNKIGLAHASLFGAGEKVLSTAPLGGGQSDRITVNTSGNYVFPNTETEINFGTTSPNGEVVISRINLLPDSLPSTTGYVKNYWIMNNYGTTGFTALDSIKFKPFTGLPVGTPANAELFIRLENEHLNTWMNLCGASNLSGDTYNYASGCNVTNAYQFYIQPTDTSTYVIQNTSASICSYDSIYLEGAFQNTAGIYSDTTVTSPTTFLVTITSLSIIIVDSSITQSGTTLTANQGGGTYQWLDCDNNYAIVPGSNNQSFTPSINGNYAVEITYNLCIDTSTCYSILSIGIIENSFGDKLVVYPNPTHGSTTIDLGANYPSILVKIF